MFLLEKFHLALNIPVRLFPGRSDHKFQVGILRRKQFRRRQKGFHQTARFALAAARKQQDPVGIPLDRRIFPLPDHFDQRVTGKQCFQPRALPDFRLEGEDHQHFFTIFRILGNVGLAPDPHLRADVPHHRDPHFPTAFGKTDVEAGIIHHQNHIRALFCGFFCEKQHNADKGENNAEDLHDPHHPQLGGVHQNIHTGGFHLGTAHALDIAIRIEFFQFFRNSCTVKIAAGFPCHDPDQRPFLCCFCHDSLLTE